MLCLPANAKLLTAKALQGFGPQCFGTHERQHKM